MTDLSAPTRVPLRNPDQLLAHLPKVFCGLLVLRGW